MIIMQFKVRTVKSKKSEKLKQKFGEMIWKGGPSGASQVNSRCETQTRSAVPLCCCSCCTWVGWGREAGIDSGIASKALTGQETLPALLLHSTGLNNEIRDMEGFDVRWEMRRKDRGCWDVTHD